MYFKSIKSAGRLRHSWQNHFTGNYFRQGFSLIELLVVTAVILVLITLAALGVRQIGSAGKLNSAADIVSTHAMQARQHAVTHNTLAALVVLGPGAPAPGALRGIALLGVNEDGEWEQISRWTLLPEGTAFDPETTASEPGGDPEPANPTKLFASPLPTLSTHSLPEDLSFRDDDGVTDYRALVFLPTGRLLSETNSTLRVVEGVVENGVVVRTGNEDANHVRTTFLAASARPLVTRP